MLQIVFRFRISIITVIMIIVQPEIMYNNNNFEVVYNEYIVELFSLKQKIKNE